MSGEELPKYNPQPKHPVRRRAVRGVFQLDQGFFIDLREHIEKERERANYEHRAIVDALSASVRKGSGDSLRLLASPKILHPPETVPPVEQLAHFVQTAFWASLEKEEGRALHFTVNFMLPEPGEDLLNQTLLAFDEPLPYDGRALIKIGPAVGAGAAALLVAPLGNGELKIWGLRDRSYAPLSVKVIDPGSVVVKFRDTNVAAISRSEAIHIRDPLLTRSSVIWARFGAKEEGVEYDQWKDPRINAILETVKRMRLLGHGGTLIVVPAGDKWRESVSHPITYSGSKAHNPFRDAIPNLKELRGQTGHTWLEESYYWSLTTEACKMLSRLTAVDGATLITYDLDVIGFGVKLQPAREAAEPRHIFSVDPLDHENWITEAKMEQLGGMRHQSAARFIADQQDAIAFVVSQDGDVSAFACWQPPTYKVPALYAHRRLELTLF